MHTSILISIVNHTDVEKVTTRDKCSGNSLERPKNETENVIWVEIDYFKSKTVRQSCTRGAL